MLFFISRNFRKLVKNLKEYKTKLHFTIKVSVIKIDDDFNHTVRHFDRVSEPLKFRRYLYFRQVVRTSNCPFGKMSVGKMAFGKVSFGKMSGNHINIILNYLKIWQFARSEEGKNIKKYMLRKPGKSFHITNFKTFFTF